MSKFEQIDATESDSDQSPATAIDFISGEPTQASNFPSVEDLAARIRFSPERGEIWLDDRRMVLMHCDAMGALRAELVDQIGYENTRGIFTRMGYQAGATDAEISNRVREKGKVFEAFSVGPQLHGLEGLVLVEQVVCEIDVEQGRFYAEYIWHNSFEAKAHLSSQGTSVNPACWMQIGYASGFASAFLGRPILYRETRCAAMGYDTCGIVGKPTEKWENAETDLAYFNPGRFERRQRTTATPADIKKKPVTPNRLGKLVGVSFAFNRAIHLLRKASPTDTSVLLVGETGVGKNEFAKLLHRLSPRKGSEFVPVHCATVTDKLMEAELFGVEKGAYKGVTKARIGRLERAGAGTLFLEQVDLLTPGAQARLMQVLRDGTYVRVGGKKRRAVTARIVAATAISLQDAVEQGDFRADLYHLLSVYPIRVPPLRDRRTDISLLLDLFLKRYADKYFKKVTGFTERAVAAVMAYGWPGNIRELQTRIERAIILCEDHESISFSHLFQGGDDVDLSVFTLNTKGSLEALFDHAATPDGPKVPASTMETVSTLIDHGVELATVTDLLIRVALRRTSGNQSAAARLLGMTRAQIQYRVAQMNTSENTRL